MGVINFKYTQLGTGNAAPDNIRPIVVPLNIDGIGKIGAGRLDTETHELVETHRMYQDKWKNYNLRYTMSNCKVKEMLFPQGDHPEPNWDSVCNATMIVWHWTEDDTPHYYFGSARIYMFLPKDFDEEQVIQVCGKLTTEVHHSLTEAQYQQAYAQLKIYLGFTQTSSMQDIQHRMQMNEPHLVTSLTDGSHSFNTDMISSLKECKIYFNPVQSGSGDPTPDNIRNITGWTGLNAYRTGKNKARVVAYGTENTSNVNSTQITSNGFGTSINTTQYTTPDTSLIVTQTQYPDSTKYAYQNGYYAVVVDNLIYEKNYDISFKITDIISNPLNVNTATMFDLVLCSPDGRFNRPSSNENGYVVYKNIKWGKHPTTLRRSNFEIRNCGMSFTMSEFMVTEVGEEDRTFEPYNGTKIPIDWSSTAGTLYGGYVDLKNGTLVSTYGYMQMSALDWYKFPNKDVFYSAQVPNLKAEGYYILPTLLCNKYTTTNASGDSSDAVQKPDKTITLHTAYNPPRLWLRDTDYTNATDLKASLSDAYICYLYAEPVVYSLDPVSLKTLRGINNIWSNANGNVELKYWKH